ncbi:MAG TPA: PD-(D/E)XK nuclease family protein, partial [Planctomycetaceae bacterium]|nr:PD-(D/E)XK nuclease family protein [Planctomycetaceae bacterium]
PLARLPPFKALLNVLKMELEDWPFRRLTAFLTSSLFCLDWRELAGGQAARDVAAELRRVEAADGRGRILAALERAAAQSPPAESAADSARTSSHAPAARRALLLLQRLSETTHGLRRSHNLDGWSSVVVDIVRTFGLDGVSLENDAPAGSRSFGETLASILFDAARAERVADIEPIELTLSEFVPLLTDLFEQQSLMCGRREEGRLRVIAAEQVRNLEVSYLFLAGLAESSFPRHRTDDCLYGESERQELNRLGLALGHRTLRAQEELLMFYGVVTRARKQLLLTYPVVTAEGQPLSPSPYLAAITELFDPAALKTGLEEQLDPVPPPDRVLTAADARVRAMFEALEGRPALFAAVASRRELAAAAINCLAAVEMNVRRFETAGFTNYEGRLENPANLDGLMQRFSHEHEFSATELEAYAQCPFRFFLAHVLKLETPEPPGIETDFRGRGTLVHEVLAELHRELFEAAERAPGPRQAPRGADLAAMFQALVEQKLESRPAASDVHSSLRRIEQRLLTEWAEAYGRQWDEYLAALPRDAKLVVRPARFETPFGSAAQGAAAHAPGGEHPALVVGNGTSAVRIGGRIDRIDAGLVDNQIVFSVIDYKTGRPRSARFDTLDSGRSLQLILYMLAVMRLEIVGPKPRPWHAGYWRIRESGFVSGVKLPRAKSGETWPALDESVWESLVETLEGLIPKLAAGIRGGRFPVFNADSECTGHCPYNTVCRVAQVRSLSTELKKTWAP